MRTAASTSEGHHARDGCRSLARTGMHGARLFGRATPGRRASEDAGHVPGRRDRGLQSLAGAQQALLALHARVTSNTASLFRRRAASSADELLVRDPVRPVSLGAEPLVPVLLVGLEVALEPDH